jgi:hypothetical protein
MKIAYITHHEFKEMKLKKRSWFFRWLRNKLGINALALEVYKLKDRIIRLENKNSIS